MTEVRVKRGETVNAKGETVSEKYGFVKDIEPEDKVNFQATKITTNPYGTEWVKYEKKKLDYFNIKDAIIKDMENYIPEYPIIKREQSKNSHLLVGYSGI